MDTGLEASLVESGVLAVTETGEVEVTAGYLESVEAYRQRPADAVESVREQRDDAGGVIDELGGVDPGLVAHLCVLAERMADRPFEALVRTALVVQTLEGDPPPTAGVPEGFVPIRGDQVDAVVRLYRRAVVYVWREECPPCDVTREDLETLDPALFEGTGRFAVYGPASARHLQEAYDVTGGPALLFAADGAVRSRLYGAQHTDAIRSEIRALAE